MATVTNLALRFQRSELLAKGNLSPAGRACLAETTGPQALLPALIAVNHRDALFALAMMLPHRQTVWWACLGVRLIPGLERNPAELAAVEAAEAWVQTNAAAAAERAGAAADLCDTGDAPGWAAMAAWWAGPSLAPRGQQPVAPAPHLPGVACRTALLLTANHPQLSEHIGFADLLGIGLDLMAGDLGRKAQAALRERLAAAA